MAVAHCDPVKQLRYRYRWRSCCLALATGGSTGVVDKAERLSRFSAFGAALSVAEAFALRAPRRCRSNVQAGGVHQPQPVNGADRVLAWPTRSAARIESVRRPPLRIVGGMLEEAWRSGKPTRLEYLGYMSAFGSRAGATAVQPCGGEAQSRLYGGHLVGTLRLRCSMRAGSGPVGSGRYPDAVSLGAQVQVPRDGGARGQALHLC